MANGKDLLGVTLLGAGILFLLKKNPKSAVSKLKENENDSDKGEGKQPKEDGKKEKATGDENFEGYVRDGELAEVNNKAKVDWNSVKSRAKKLLDKNGYTSLKVSNGKKKTLEKIIDDIVNSEENRKDALRISRGNTALLPDTVLSMANGYSYSSKSKYE